MGFIINSEQKRLLNESRRLLLDNSLKEKQIADLIFISETTFRMMYNRVFGVPPKRYIKLVKMKRAMTYLRITDMSISEIAYATGYINASKFSTAFKEIYGMVPSKYRESCGFGAEKTV